MNSGVGFAITAEPAKIFLMSSGKLEIWRLSLVAEEASR